MERQITALLPRRRTPRTAQLQHPSFPPGSFPAVAPPTDMYCADCEWLAGMIRAGRHVQDYAWTAILHVDACHRNAGGAA